MARIAGVNIPTGKRVPIALTYITGIGSSIAEEICDAVKIDKSRRVNELSDSEVLAMREHIDANFTVEGDLRREVQCLNNQLFFMQFLLLFGALNIQILLTYISHGCM